MSRGLTVSIRTMLVSMDTMLRRTAWNKMHPVRIYACAYVYVVRFLIYMCVHTCMYM
jgi:hypothetical protein